MKQVRETLRLSEQQVRRALCSLPSAFVLRDGSRQYFGAFPSDRSEAIDPAPLSQGHLSGDQPEWVGVLPYEAFRQKERTTSEDRRAEPHLSSPLWHKYEAVGEFKTDGVELIASAEVHAERLRSGIERVVTEPAFPELTWAEEPETASTHEQRISVALSEIEKGALYQVNLARRFRFFAKGHAISILDSLGSLAEAPYSCALDLGDVQVVSTSPELFLSMSPSGHVLTSPIKGTRPRHPDPEKDEALARMLDESEKEQAELTMVIDIERNDLGRLALPGSVHLVSPPRVVTHPTVHHREATICAELRPNISREELISAMMPSGSVTGAPKVAAMDLIRRLEAERRGLYTGAIGYLSRSGTLRLSMAIRTLTLKGGEAHYFAGGGIVADSDPAQELAETIWKSEQLRGLVRI